MQLPGPPTFLTHDGAAVAYSIPTRNYVAKTTASITYINNTLTKQQISANAHKTRDSISLISHVGCLGWFPKVSAKIHFLNLRRSQKSRKCTKTRYFSTSKSFKVIDVGTLGELVSSACYDAQQVCVHLQPFSC